MKIVSPTNVNGRLEWNDEFRSKWQGSFDKAQKFIDSEVLRLSTPYVPFQTGALNQSGIASTTIGSGEVIYNTPYARYLYYGKVMIGRAPKQVTDIDLTYNGAPMRGALWFERMKTDHLQDIKRGVSKILEE